MNETASDPMSGDVAARLDELVREVRRQGRAAVAAQAAAESCLEQVVALAHALEGTANADPRPTLKGTANADPRPMLTPAEQNDEPDPVEEGAGMAADAAWIAALLPVADALDRVAAQASTMAERRAQPERRRFWFFRAPEGPGPELRAMAEGLRVLREQLAEVLASRGITADRRVGIAVDPEVHRVIEVRPRRGSEREGVVVEVLRPGYAAGARLIREAEIVATGGQDEAGEAHRS